MEKKSDKISPFSSNMVNEFEKNESNKIAAYANCADKHLMKNNNNDNDDFDDDFTEAIIPRNIIPVPFHPEEDPADRITSSSTTSHMSHNNMMNSPSPKPRSARPVEKNKAVGIVTTYNTEAENNDRNYSVKLANKVDSADHQVQQLKSLLRQLGTKNEHLTNQVYELEQKLKLNQKDNPSSLSATMIPGLQKEITNLKEERDKLKENLHKIDAHRDHLQAQLDSITQQQLQQVHNQDGQHDKNSNQSQLMQHLQNTLEQKDQIIQQLQYDLNHSHTNHHNDQTESIKQQMNLQSILRETKALHNENQNLQQDLSQATCQIHSLTSQNTDLECQNRALIIEKENLMRQYRGLLEERNSCDYSIQNLSEERQQILQEYNQVKQDFDKIQSLSQKLDQELELRLKDVSHYEQQMDISQREYTSLYHKYEAQEHENKQLKSDLNASRQNIQDLSQYLEKILGDVAQSQANANTTKELFQAQEKEKEALMNLLNQERSQGKQLERLLELARNKELSFSIELKKLANENASLYSKMNEMHVRGNFDGICMATRVLEDSYEKNHTDDSNKDIVEERCNDAKESEERNLIDRDESQEGQEKNAINTSSISTASNNLLNYLQ